MREIKNACVIGAGAYGSALSEVFAENIDIVMLGLDYETMESINNKHINPRCLCDVRLRSNIKCRCDYDCCKDVDLIFIVTPVSAVRVVCQNILDNDIPSDIPVIMCSKGIDNETCKFTTEIAEEVGLRNKLFVLSGPSFAHEIIAGMPASVSLAGDDEGLLDSLVRSLSTSKFKVIGNNDIIGTQICGAMKNVLAVMCGAFLGAELGKSAVSMLITKAIEEIGDLVVAACGKRDTVYEMCGIGDIILTCTNDASRNIKFGKFVANGGTIDQWEGNLAEGAFTAKILKTLQARFCKLPILHNAYEMIYEKKPVSEVLKSIM